MDKTTNAEEPLASGLTTAVGRETATPAGVSSDRTARGGEFERMMLRLRQTELYLAARYHSVVRRARPPSVLLIDLDAMRDAVLRAIEELSSRHDR